MPGTIFSANMAMGWHAIVHEVASQAEMAKEIKRMRALGVGVLQQVSFDREGKRVTYTYFDTEPQGKFVLGLVYWPGGAHLGRGHRGRFPTSHP